MDGLRVMIAGFNFRGFDDGVRTGYWIGKDGFDGWAAPDARAEAAARPIGNGDFDSPQFLAARTVTLSGFYRASSMSALNKMTRELSGLLAGGATAKLRVNWHGDTTWAQVKRGLTRPKVHELGDPGLAVGEFEFEFRAADPRIFGPAEEFDPGPVSHRGNFDATPEVFVTGPQSAPYSITSQGKTVTVTQALTSGQSHRIDMATGWVYRNGELQKGATSALNVFTIPPGKPTTVSAPSGAKIRVRKTLM